MGMRRYAVTLTTVGPVHIGMGRKIGKKDYFLQQGAKLAFDRAARNDGTPRQRIAYHGKVDRPDGGKRGIPSYVQSGLDLDYPRYLYLGCGKSHYLSFPP